MTDVLILGGTGWLSGRIAAHWLRAGATVTCLARGGRAAPDGAQMVIADRDQADAYSSVATRDWHEIVDVSSNPAHVTAALAALGPRARHWTYVSSVSVYARADVLDADETAETLAPTGPDDEGEYGRDKVAAEASVLREVADRALIIRPGLIVGPGDPTDRFGYWVSRFALADTAPVLVPATPDAAVQVIDVEDLAEFAVAATSSARAGVVNAVGDVSRFADLTAAAREVAGHTGAVIPAAPSWLVERVVAYWAGPRSLPLWLPDDMPGFMTWRNDRFREKGGTLRPLRDTLARTLADERARGCDRERRAGLTRADELALLSEVSENAAP